MTLEEKIKMLMESKETIETKSGTKITDEDEDEKEDDQEDDKEDESGVDDQDKDQEDDEEQTDLSKQVKAKVNEDATEAMLEKGKSKKDPAPGKLKADDAGDKQDDKGLNAKLKVGQGKKVGSGPTGEKTDGQNESNKKNDVDQQKTPEVAAKITVGESMEAMFAGETLSEEFVAKATTIFESAVSAIVEQRLAEELEVMQEEFQSKLEEAVDQVQAEIVESIDGFINESVEEWVKDNSIALERGIQAEMVTNFIDGLKTLFKESYIEVPEDKLNVVEEQAERITELEQALVVINEDHERLTKENLDLHKSAIVESVGKGLTVQQKEKFASLCEGLGYASDEDFEAKVKTVRESYFTGEKSKTKEITEEVDVASKAGGVAINKYVEALSGSLQFKKL